MAERPHRLAARHRLREKAREADVYPLLDELSFIRDRAALGHLLPPQPLFRPRDDFALIADGDGA